MSKCVNGDIVFALLKEMFGEDQERALADQLKAALMLAYNKRRVG